MTIERDYHDPVPPLDLDDPEDTSADDVGTLEAKLRTAAQWMVLDGDGNISVRGGEYSSDRVVGRVQGPDTPTVLAGLILRFSELEKRWSALRSELDRSRDPAKNLKKLRSFVHWAEAAEAIGNFDTLLGRAYRRIERIESHIAETRAAKTALIERAQALATAAEPVAAAAAMDELIEEWKKAGSLGKREDDELWDQLRKVRREVSRRRSKQFAERKRSRGEARDAKRALVDRAKVLAISTDFEATFVEMQDLMDAWKEAGRTGSKRLDDQLWDDFKAARDPFFVARRSWLAEGRREARDSDRGATRGRHRSGRGQRDDRQGRGGASGRRQRQQRGSGDDVLRSSLAELVGPLRDLFPASRDDDKDKD